MVLSRDCDGCCISRYCKIRYEQVEINGKVYCPDGTVHLVDSGSLEA